MAYRLERQESVIEGLKRVIGEEIEVGRRPAFRRKEPDATRPSMKRARASKRFARCCGWRAWKMGGAYAARECAPARHRPAPLGISRRIRHHRDVRRPEKEVSDETRGKLRSVRAGLVRKRNQAGKEEDVGIVLDRAAAALGKVQAVCDWPLEENGFAAIGPGLEETYRAGRAALGGRAGDPSPEKLPRTAQTGQRSLVSHAAARRPLDRRDEGV